MRLCNPERLLPVLAATAFAVLLRPGVGPGADAGWRPVPPPVAADAGRVNPAPPPAAADPPPMVEWPGPADDGPSGWWPADLFTPPPLRSDPDTGILSPVPRPPGPAEERAEPSFGIELLEVCARRFPVFLAGHVVAGGEQGAFVVAGTGETLVGGAGLVIPGTGLRVESFSVGRIPPDGIPGTGSCGAVATAVLADSAGRRTTLTEGVTAHLPDAEAVLRRMDDGSLCRLTAGGVLDACGATYRLLAVRLRPPSADVAREAPGGGTCDVRTLVPAGCAGTPPPACPQTPSPTDK